MVLSQPVEVLRQYFHYDNFRANQLEIIEEILAGKNVIAILPTGAGKSICYQIPALMAEKFSIVISPLIALMKNQIDELKNLNIPAESIHSGTDINSYYSIKKRIESNEIKLLYVSPERLSNHYFIELIEQVTPEYLFVDEAHCISEWGHNFRPSYRKINNFCQALGIKKVSAFTASAIPEVVQDIKTQLGFSNPKIFINGFERNNLSINVEITSNKKSKLLNIISKDSEIQPTIVYTSTRKACEELSAFLNLNKIPCAFYHAGMPHQRRQQVQEEFLNGNIKVIAATNAFGMGINKSDIRKIIHYNMPSSIENYYQEIGRAGRDGNESSVFLFYENSDMRIQERLIRTSFPDEDEIIVIYNLLNNFAKIALGSKSDKFFRLNSEFFDLLKSKKISEQKFFSTIDYFEDLNIISRDNFSYLKAFVKINSEKDRFRQFVMETLFEYRNYLIFLAKFYSNSIFDTMTEINLQDMASHFETTVNRIRHTLEKLNNFGLINYESNQSQFQFRFNFSRFDPEKYDIFKRNKNQLLLNSLNKIRKMQEFVLTKDCRFDFILRYFGQVIENYRCGKCDNCTSKNDSQDVVEYISEIIVDSLKDLSTSIEKNDLVDALLGEENRIDLWNIKNYSALKFYNKLQIEEVIDILKVRGIISQRKTQIKLRNTSVKNETSEFDEKMILFNQLKEIRNEAAKKFFQPEHLICSDEILLQIIEQLPKTYTELLSINGFNQRMFNKIGDDFLKAINEFKNKSLTKSKLPQELEKIFELVNKKYSLSHISEVMKVSESIISIQIETLLKFYPELNINSLLPQKHYESITKAISEGYQSNKIIKEICGENISYAEIRIVKAKLKIN